MAEIALGVIPLIGSAFTTYRSLYHHVRAFRHYAKDLERTTKTLKIERDKFKLECWILLKSALGKDSIRQLKSCQDQVWDDPAINTEFEKNLRSSYGACESVIEDIGSQLKEFQKELEEFSPLIKDQKEHETLSDVVRRCRKRIHVTVNRKKYEGLCQKLKEANHDLKDLSDKIERLEGSCPAHKQCLLENRRHRGDWGAACKARRASSALYQGLQQTWSCHTSPHGQHSLRLFIDTPNQRRMTSMTTSMRMSLSVVGVSSEAGRLVPTAFHLAVDSKDVQWSEDDYLPSPHLGEDLERCPKRLKRIEPSEQVNRVVQMDLEKSESSAHEDEGKKDLASVVDLCSHIGEHCCHRAQPAAYYIGYLEVQDHVRYDFFRSQGRTQTRDENVPLGALLGSFDPREMNVTQRLKLARTVAITALTYFDTPWMKDMWRLRDLCLLLASASSPDPNAILSTLHLEVDLRSSKQLQIPQHDSSMEMCLTPDSSAFLSDDELLDRGVFNKSLHSLGVALVGIETSQDFDPNNWDDVRNVRKYSRGSMFGGKYKAIVEKCFAFNCDLNRQRSHRLAFESIVGSLEDMVAALDLEDEND
ncbi:hypothetical protein LIA77_10943 [Sarocladium implicatum]|nr:hypothetical protein LIA77_10943 [Sarocladium implicatum]